MLFLSALALIIFGFIILDALTQNENTAAAQNNASANDIVKTKINALLLYHCRTGHTLEVANAIVQGIQAAGGSATLVTAKNFTSQIINHYDVLIVGSPC